MYAKEQNEGEKGALLRSIEELWEGGKYQLGGAGGGGGVFLTKIDSWDPFYLLSYVRT